MNFMVELHIMLLVTLTILQPLNRSLILDFRDIVPTKDNVKQIHQETWTNVCVQLVTEAIIVRLGFVLELLQHLPLFALLVVLVLLLELVLVQLATLEQIVNFQFATPKQAMILPFVLLMEPV
jgi:hypothetical protein